MSFVRAASRVSRVGFRAPAYRASPVAWTAQRAFSQSAIRCSDQHAEETFEEFTSRYDASWRGDATPHRKGIPCQQEKPLSSIKLS